MSDSKPEDGYLDKVQSSLDYSQIEFDKSLTFIAAGLLAGTFAFIDKIVKLEKANCKSLLLWGWTILGISIALSSFGHLRSIHHHTKFIKNSKIKKQVDLDNERTRADEEIALINYGMIILIVLGAALIYIFIYKNF